MRRARGVLIPVVVSACIPFRLHGPEIKHDCSRMEIRDGAEELPRVDYALPSGCSAPERPMDGSDQFIVIQSEEEFQQRYGCRDLPDAGTADGGDDDAGTGQHTAPRIDFSTQRLAVVSSADAPRLEWIVRKNGKVVVGLYRPEDRCAGGVPPLAEEVIRIVVPATAEGVEFSECTGESGNCGVMFFGSPP